MVSWKTGWLRTSACGTGFIRNAPGANYQSSRLCSLLYFAKTVIIGIIMINMLITLSAVVLLYVLCDYSCYANVTAARDTSVFNHHYSSDEVLVKKRAASGTNVEIRLVALDENNLVHEIPEEGIATKFIIKLQELLSTSSRPQQCNLGSNGEMKVEVVIGSQVLEISLDNVSAETLGQEEGVNFQTLFRGVTDELSEDEKIDLDNLTWPNIAHVIELLQNPDLEIQKLFEDKAHLSAKVAQLLGRLINERKGTKQAQNAAGKMRLELDDKTKEADALAINLASEKIKKQELDDQLKSVQSNLSALKASATRLEKERDAYKAAGEKKKAELAEANNELEGKRKEIHNLEQTNTHLQGEVKKLNGRVSSLAKDLEGLRKSLQSETTGRQNAEADAKQKKATIEKINGDLEVVRKERQQLQGKADKLEIELAVQTKGRYDAEEMVRNVQEQAQKADELFGKAIEGKQRELIAAESKTKAVQEKKKEEIAQLNHEWEREKSRLERQLSTVTEAVKEMTKAFEEAKKTNQEKDAIIKKLKAKNEALMESLESMNMSLKLNKCHCPGLWRHSVIMMGYLNPVKEGGMVRQVLGMIVNGLGFGKMLPMSAGLQSDLPEIGKHFDELVKKGVIPAPNLGPNGTAAVQNGASGKKPAAAAGGKRK
ncbi:hypothetical protein DdX_22339 [Ditylenchus destructor]|uniref:Uncharacterized protein n=1 Tax=Ditylenchus destructor TaxID=166010 RepID=A0AAD4QQY4_9BILA|nr:hypothetical protein DdX_22339 [Ditylenchus destructor]